MILADCKCPPSLITAVSSAETGHNSTLATLLSPGYPLDYCPGMECHTTVSFATPHLYDWASTDWSLLIRFGEFSLDGSTWMDVGVLRQSGGPDNNNTLVRYAR